MILTSTAFTDVWVWQTDGRAIESR